MHNYLFPYNIDIHCYSNVASCGTCLLSHLVGNTLSEMLRYKECPLELVRLNKDGYILIAHRRIDSIAVDIHYKKE